MSREARTSACLLQTGAEIAAVRQENEALKERVESSS